MIPKELLQNVRRIEITTKRLVTDVFAGQYHSVFKGQGMEFEEVREYQIGDDIRAIDWNVTARTGRPHIKKFVEERELTVMIVVDASLSCRFATVKQLKSKLATEMAATIAFSAIKNNDKVGLLIFTNQTEKFIAPRKGLRHVLRVIREVLYPFEAKGESTDIPQALDYLNKVMTRRTVSFIISDFFVSGPQRPNAEEGLKKALNTANRRHDLVAVTLNDPAEVHLPSCGLVELEDAETGQKVLVDSSDPKIRQRYHHEAMIRLKARDLLFSSVGIDHVDISTAQPFVGELVKFFLRRRCQLAHK